MRNANRPQVFEYGESGGREPCTEKRRAEKYGKATNGKILHEETFWEKESEKTDT